MTSDVDRFAAECNSGLGVDASASLPAPLTPADCDVSDFDWFPLKHQRLRKSEFWLRSSDQVRSISVDLWCSAWEQVPAASLPDDDIILAKLAGFGRNVDAWRAVRDLVMAPWVRTSDGRFYHPVLSEVAIEQFARKWAVENERENDKIRKRRKRALGTTSNGPKGKSKARASGGRPADTVRNSVPREGEGEGEGIKLYHSTPPTPNGAGDQPEKIDPGGVFERCVAAAGVGLADPNSEPGLLHTAPRIAAAIAAGCDLELDILPVITRRTATARASPIATWAYFEPAWIDARDKRIARLPSPNPNRFEVVAHEPSRARPTSGNAPAHQRAVRHQAAVDVLEELGYVAPVGAPAIAR